MCLKRTAFLLVAALILMTAQGGIVGVADSKTLTGEFVWNQGSRGKLRATFRPTGENQWDVAFRFVFNGQSHTYKGSAAGNLSSGVLKGRVKNENKRRTFAFSGSFDGGKFRGTHAEVGRNGKEYRTGTLTLSR